MRGTTRDMSDRHEQDLAERLGGRRTRGSGNQFNDQMDGRHHRFEEDFALAWDGKSTRGKSIGVSLAMWEKAVEQAGGERAALALRWYLNERLTETVDLMAVSLDDFEELLTMARNPNFEPEQVKSLCRLLQGEGHMTPIATRQILKTLGVE